jgi:hypothetical protein
MAKQTFSVGQVLTAAQMTSLQQTAMGGGSATAKTASYTLVAADAGTVVSVNSTSATTITVNTGLFAAGDTVTIQNWGSGATTITAGTATVNSSASLVLAQYEGGQLYFTSASASIFIKGDVSGGAPVSSSINKNYLINGGFAIAQRGTSFTSTGGANNDDTYVLDRWYILSDGNDAIDVTQDTTTVPTNGQFAIALDVETANKKFGIATIIENKDVIGLVGNTVTFSFKAKVSSTTKLNNVKAAIVAWSGTADTVTSDIISAWGGNGVNPTLIANATYENSPANLSLTTSYDTYSVSAAVDTASTTNLILFIWSDVTDTTTGDFLYIAESKLELGSSATAFQYAGGTIEGELAACQRYYYRVTSGVAGDEFGVGMAYATTAVIVQVPFVTTMRIAPTGLETTGTASDYGILNPGSSFSTANSVPAFYHATRHGGSYTNGVAVSGGQIAGYATMGGGQTSSAYLGWSAEL